MFKNILRLLAASTSFVALLLITNPAIALIADNSVNQVESPIVSLSLISPSLEFINSNNDLSSHLGCSCAACVQNIKNI